MHYIAQFKNKAKKDLAESKVFFVWILCAHF